MTVSLWESVFRVCMAHSPFSKIDKSGSDKRSSHLMMRVHDSLSNTKKLLSSNYGLLIEREYSSYISHKNRLINNKGKNEEYKIQIEQNEENIIFGNGVGLPLRHDIDSLFCYRLRPAR